MDCNFSVFDAYYDGENLWFAAVEYNALYKISLKNGGLEYLGSFPDERIYQWRLYTSVYVRKDKLFFIPGSACEVGVYDIKARRFSKINIGIEKKENDIFDIQYQKKFTSAFFYDDKLVMIPCCYHKLVVYDFKTKKVSTDSTMYKFLKDKYVNTGTSADNFFYFCWHAKRINDENIVFDLHANANVFIKYNLKNNQWREYEVGERTYTYIFIEYIDGKVWLFDDKNMLIVSYDEEDNTEEVHELPISARGATYSNMFIYKDDLYLIDFIGSGGIKFSLKSKQFFDVEGLSSGKYNLCRMVVKSDDMLCFYDRKKSDFLIYKNNTVTVVPCVLTKKTSTEIENKVHGEFISERGGVVWENLDLKLNDYINVIHAGILNNDVYFDNKIEKNVGIEVLKKTMRSDK